jgi:hypothetical protein
MTAYIRGTANRTPVAGARKISLTQGSPQIEESAYWFNLLIDTVLPICENAAQRPRGQVSAFARKCP